MIKSISRSSEPGASWLNSDVMLAAADQIYGGRLEAKRRQKLNSSIWPIKFDCTLCAVQGLNLAIHQGDFNPQAKIRRFSGRTNKANSPNNTKPNKILKTVFCHCVLVNRWLASGI